MELLKICNFDPKALESCENFNVSNVAIVNWFPWFAVSGSVKSNRLSL